MSSSQTDSTTREHDGDASDIHRADVRKFTAADRRHFTTPGGDPADEVDWQRRDARIVHHGTGAVVFEQTDVEFPSGWSQNATDIVSQKYFRGELGSPPPGSIRCATSWPASSTPSPRGAPPTGTSTTRRRSRRN